MKPPFRKMWFGVSWEIGSDCKGGMMIVARTRKGAIRKAVVELTNNGELQHYLITGENVDDETWRSPSYHRYIRAFANLRSLTFARIEVDKITELPREGGKRG